MTEALLQAMTEYADAIRGDWSDFDGRTEKLHILDWVDDLRVPKPDRDINWYRQDLGICTAGGGHWCGAWGHCNESCGCVPCEKYRAKGIGL